MFNKRLQLQLWQKISKKKCIEKINDNKTNNEMKSVIPREARRAEGSPSVARFVNLSRGDRARIAKGGQISICLATKPNRDRWQLRTLMFLRRVSSFLVCFAAYICVLIFLFIVCEEAKTTTPDLISGWQSIPGEIYNWFSAWTPTWNLARTPGGGGTLQIFGRGFAAGTLKPLP